MAAVLASYPSIAGHLSAAWLWGLLRSRPETLHITCRSPRPRKRPFVVHTADLARSDLARCERIPVTSLSRTILDVAVVFTRSGLEDRERDDALLPAGIETTRVTGPRLDREPAAVVDSVRRHLARRSPA